MTGTILVLGPPGAGKTSSARNLAKHFGKETYFINTERKDLPFPETFKWTNRPKSTSEVLDLYKQIIDNGKSKGIELVLQDSFSAFTDLALHESRALHSGFDIWSDYNKKIGNLFMRQKELADIGIHSIMIAHDETVLDEGSALIKRSAKVKGKEWEAMIEKEFNIVLWAEVVPEESDLTKFKHQFMTNTNGKIPAKSPIDMLDRFIPNDLFEVIKKVKAYGIAA